MRIQVGKFTLCSDSYSMWITEECEISKGKNKGQMDTRRVAGYSTSLKNLSRSLMESKVLGSDAESLKELIEVLRVTFEDMVELNREAVENDFKKIERIGK